MGFVTGPGDTLRVPSLAEIRMIGQDDVVVQMLLTIHGQGHLSLEQALMMMVKTLAAQKRDLQARVTKFESRS